MIVKAFYISSVLLLLITTVCYSIDDIALSKITMDINTYAGLEQVTDSTVLFYDPWLCGGIIYIQVKFNSAANCSYEITAIPSNGNGNDPDGTWYYYFSDYNEGISHNFETEGNPPHNVFLMVYGVGVGCINPDEFESPYTLVMYPE
jgi:hypothetical protein